MGRKTIAVLLVEDDEAHAELIRRSFEREAEPASLTVVRTLREARQRMTESAFDLAVIDLKLPDGNGLELLPAEKEEAPFPAVVLTAHGNEQSAVEAMKRGALDYLVKSEATLADMPRLALQALREWEHIQGRRQAEEALRQSEECFRGIFENNIVGMYRTTPDGRILMANPALIRMLGFSSFEELARRNLAEEGFASESPRATFIQHIERAGEVVGLESVWITHDGRTIHVRESARAVRDAAGSTLYYEGMVEDVTEWRRAERALQESEERFRGIAEQSFDVIFTTDTEGRVTYVSPACESVLGFSPDEVIGKPFADFLAKSDKPRALERFAEALQGKVRGVLAFEMVNKEGGPVSVELTASRALRGGEVAGIQGVVRDVTERRRAEEALHKAYAELETRVEQRTAELAAANQQLETEIADRKAAEAARRESEERFRLAFEEGPVGMAMFSDEGRFVHVNRALCEMLAYSAEELTGREIAALTHPDGRQVCAKGSQQVLRGAVAASTWENRYLRKDGQIVWARVTATAVRDQQGKIMYGLAMIENVTQRKQAEERAEKLRQQLAHLARVETMGEMATGIAHELNQPLAAVVMRAEAAAHRLQMGREGSKQEQIDVLRGIADEGYRAGQIIRRMRDFIKKAEPRRSTVDLTDVVAEVLTLVRSDLRLAGITLTADVDPDLPHIMADRIQLQQVLLNLIRNAMEAIDAAGSGDHALSVRVRARDESLEIAVSDTGCGIPDGGLDQLFERYFTTKPGGLGMGLAISRSIVEAYGGRIWATQNADRGATFTFTLPIGDRQ